MTNEIRTLHRLHSLSWSSNYITTSQMSVSYYLTTLFDSCIPWWQLVSTLQHDQTLPLSVKGVACETKWKCVMFAGAACMHMLYSDHR